MNRFVRRSTIVAVALATTLSAGVALASNTGISPELLKSGLTSSSTATAALTRALNSSSSFTDATRFGDFHRQADQREFASFKTSAFDSGKSGVVVPARDGSIQFRTALAGPVEMKSAFGA